MSTNIDRELLEQAAKAAGLVGWVWNEEFRALQSPPEETSCGPAHQYWNPLADDGDALRLAVKLGLLHAVGTSLSLFRKAWDDLYVIGELPDDDFEATRRAIVRAAAEMGKAMP